MSQGRESGQAAGDLRNETAPLPPAPLQAVPLHALPLADLLIKRRALRRRLAAQPDLQPLRIAVLSGSTAGEVLDLLELHLLEAGFRPQFWQSDYGRFPIDAVHDTAALEAFAPQLVYVHTSVRNLQGFPPPNAAEPAFEAAVAAELARFEQLWESLDRKLACMVLQNNFEFPPEAILGNLDATHPAGHTRFVAELNREFARAARARPRLLLNDVASLSARLGLDRWFDPSRWFSYKIVTTPEAGHALALSLAALIRGLYGKARKLLVLDLDNTLWGGVIGESELDGLDHIHIGRETPLAEAFTAFQQYCLALHQRGVLLAVCSKNDEATARAGFTHPDSILRLEHFAGFKANWLPKSENILAIAHELNLLPESFVFLDDNPAERALVRAQIPRIAVPELGEDVATWPAALAAHRFFEPVQLSSEDLHRPALYRAEHQRQHFEQTFATYGDYLESLQMSAEIEPFKPVYLDRIAQLTNKTNQFNLTTRRYTRAQLETLAADRNTVALYGKLTDRFGEHGLVSVLLARREHDTLTIDLWLMSCRVLKRNLEAAMLDALIERAAAMGIRTLRGVYIPSAKNTLVRDLYPGLGFTPAPSQTGETLVFTCSVAGYTARNHHIRVPQLVHG